MKQKLILLDDESSLVDELSEKTHEALAEQLFQLIAESNAPGRVIGLEGKWGSGKSTVIRILREKLKVLETCFIFCTDAWEHEGDPLRKLFLLSLIDELKDSDRVNSSSKTDLETIREDVVSKTSESKEEHTSLLSRFGKWVSFLTLFVPIGCIILDKTWDGVTIGLGHPIHWLFVVGLFLAMAPFWAFAYQFVHWCVCWRKYKNANRGPFALFDINAGRDFHHIIVSESEKDSVAFAESFKKIIGCVSNLITHFVIVIDNLDRINHTDALKIWSTLQTFVQAKDNKDFPTLWIIIPYTEEGIRALWKNENNGSAPVKDESEADVNVVKSFLDKAFQLRFEVPDLLIGDWHSFAEKKAKEVFVDFSESDVKLILDMICWTRRRSSDAPSPREIKLYLNQVRLLHEIHSKNKIALSSICYYATQRYLCGISRQSIGQKIRDGKISTHSLPLNPAYDSLVDDLCSILFSVPHNKGMQLLLHDEITKSLSEGDTKRLQELYKIHKEAFIGVLDYCLTKAPDAAAYSYAITLEKSLAPLSEQFHEKALSHWKDWLMHKDERIVGGGSYLSIIGFGRVVASDKDVAEKTWLHFADAFKDDLLKNNSSPSRWIESLDNAKQEYGFDVQIEYSGNMLPLLKQCGNLNEEQRRRFASYLHLSSSAEDQLASEIKPGQKLDSSLPLAFSILADAGIRFVDKILEAVQRTFTTPGPRSDSNYQMIACFDQIQDGEVRRKGIYQFLRMGPVWETMINLNRDYPKNLLAYLVPKYLGTIDPAQVSSKIKIRKDYIQNILVRWQTSSAPTAETIYDLTRQGADYSFLRLLSGSTSNAMAGEIVRRAVRDEDLRLAKGSNILEWFTQLIKFVSGDDCHKIAALFVKADDIIQELEGIQEGSLAMLLPALWLLVENMTMTQIKRVRPGIERILSMASQDEWNKAFASLNTLVSLLRDLREYESALSLTTAFCEAFKQWLSAKFEEKEQKTDFEMDDIAVLFNFLGTAFKEDVGVRINHLAEQKAFVLRPAEARLVLDFAAHEKWMETDGDVICQAIQNAVINKKKDDLLQLVPILFAGWKCFKLSDRFASTLKEPVEAWLKDAPDDISNSLHELCFKLNVKLTP